MSLPAHLSHLDALLDLLVDAVVADVLAGTNKNSAASGQEQQRCKEKSLVRLHKKNAIHEAR